MTARHASALSDGDRASILILTEQAVQEAENTMSPAGRAWVLDRADEALELLAGSGVRPQARAGLRRIMRRMRRELDHERQA